MKIPTPRGQGYSGGYGGVGSRPADRAWTPERKRGRRDGRPVPRKFRGLRLRRRPRGERSDTPARTSGTGDVVLGVLFMLCGLSFLLATADDSRYWGFSPLMCLLLAGVGAVFLGRGIGAHVAKLGSQRPPRARRPRATAGPLAAFVRRSQGWVILGGGFGAWVLIGLPLWGAFHPLKLVLALALVVGLGFSLDVDRRFSESAGSRKAGSREARAKRPSAWPPRRRVIAILTGVSLVVVATWQVFRRDGLPSLPLVRGLYLLMAWGMGASLAGIALTSGPSRRAAAPAPPGAAGGSEPVRRAAAPRGADPSERRPPPVGASPHHAVRRTQRPRMERLPAAGAIALTAVVIGLAYLFFLMFTG